MIYRVYINFKNGILDPESEAIMKIISNMGFNSIKNISKGKYFDVEISSAKNALKDLEKISSDLLSNPVIENFKIIKK
tara:strand:- start:537 stop:770 length:234 start_codon:yes stop_codon:yes gene_type:complete